MNGDSEEELPYEIGEATLRGDFERVKAWLAGGSSSDPRPINGGDETGWTILMWTARGESLEHVEFVRYLIYHEAPGSTYKVWGEDSPRSILPVDLPAKPWRPMTWFPCSLPPARQ